MKIRDLKKTTMATGTSLTKRFNEENNGLQMRYNSLCTFFRRPLRNSNVKWPISELSGEREPRRLSSFNFQLCTGFCFVLALTVINNVNDFRNPRDS